MSFLPPLTVTDAGADLRLRAYLTDHLAGAQAGLALARRFSDHLGETPAGAVLDEVTAEIAADLASLVAVLEALDVPRQVPKELVALAGERLSRAKPNGQLLGRSPLTFLVELEGLTAGVSGKRSLWRSLQVALPQEPLESPTLAELVARADGQLERLEELRDDIARTALAE